MSRHLRKHKQVGAKVRSWLIEPMNEAVKIAVERLRKALDIQHVAIMPDVHLAHTVCIGTVVATREVIYPQAVGGDIGCGMATVRFDAEADAMAPRRSAWSVLDALPEAVPIMRHRQLSSAPPLPADLGPLSTSSLDTIAKRDGRIEFGTLGRGNHFAEFQADEDGALWLMVHTGSRTMGQHVRAHAMQDGAKLCHLDVASPKGAAYLSDAKWAVRYASANRRLIVKRVAHVARQLLGIRVVWSTYVDCCHNHVRQETHFGEPLWIHRKGANAADIGQAGLIPGSMGTTSYHVTGRGCAEALRSSSHGAGRALSRHEAQRLITTRALARQLESVWFDRKRAGQLCQEAPAAYKDIAKVMRAQKELVRIVRKLEPMLCYKGG